mgnify:CR=1 FL=1
MEDIDKQQIIKILIDKGNKEFAKPFEPIKFTGIPEVDILLNNLESYPHIFVLACVMDRQIKAERAWQIPYLVGKEIGSFEFNDFNLLQEDYLIGLFIRLKLHRFNETMAKSFYLAVELIDKKYGGNASLIWQNNPKSATVVSRFLEFKGVGVKIATMAANILARNYKIPMSDRLCLDISPDVQVNRVFTRLGIIPLKATVDQLIYAAREMNPDYPGIFDLSAWEIGRQWCRPNQPLCEECYLNAVCPKQFT